MFYERFLHLCNTFFDKPRKPNPVASDLGISSASVTKWKNGTIPDGNTLLKIAVFFNCSVDYLLGRTDQIEVNHGSDNSVSINNNNVNIGVSADDLDILKLIHKLSLIDRSKLICELSDKVNVEN